MSNSVTPAPAVEREQGIALRRVPKLTLIWRRFLRNKPAVAGLALFTLLALPTFYMLVHQMSERLKASRQRAPA